MTLPNFLGIGVPRAGTTWLHRMLLSHPEVYMPSRRKEVRFFDRYYERGLEWYESFFCPSEQANRYRAIGEISPQYFDCEACPKRIASTLPDSKLLFMLRHPVDRAYSQYGLFVQRRNFRGSFEEFVAAKPRALQKGFYSRYLKRYLNYFDQSKILCLLFENTVGDVLNTQESLSGFLNIAADKFPPAAGRRKVNSSTVPRLQFVYGFTATIARQLRNWELEPIVDFVMRSNIRRFLAKGSPLPPLDEGLRQELSESYQNEFDDLEQCMDIDLAIWRADRLTAAPASASVLPGTSNLIR